MSNIKDLRKKKVNNINYTDSRGKACTFKTASLRLPWIISKLWTNKLVGENPDIFYSKETVEEGVSIIDSDVKVNKDTTAISKEERERVPYEFNVKEMVQELMECGIVCFIPKFVDGKYFVDIIPENKYTYVQSESGRLLHFEYTRQNVRILHEGIPITVSIKTIYYIDENDIAWMIEEYGGDIKFKKEAVHIGSELPPKIVDLQDSQPIWINAAQLIKDADDTYTEMMYDMQLSRKLLALPDRFLNRKDPRSTGETMLSISDTHRAVRTMPMGNSKDEHAAGPTWYEGKYDPDPFVDTLNFQLHLISLNCYFGSRYLSYDKESNMITATEVNSTDNDLYINRESLLPYVQSIFVHIVKIFDMLSGKPPKEVDVEHGDSIFDNKDKRNNQLSLDASVGLINKKQYLMQRYGLDEHEVINWLPEEEDTIDE